VFGGAELPRTFGMPSYNLINTVLKKISISYMYCYCKDYLPGDLFALLKFIVIPVVFADQ